MLNSIKISKRALKDLQRAPRHIQDKLLLWAETVRNLGLFETRRRPGWHDEPLLGKRIGQRSLRLNIKWRAIYIINQDKKIEFIEIIEVTPHAY